MSPRVCLRRSESKAGAHCARTTSRRTNLYPVGSAPYQAPSCVAARAKGSKEDGTILHTRRVSAKSGHGHASTLDRGIAPTRYGAVSLYSSGLKGRTGRHQPSFEIAPQSHQELARHGHYGDAAGPALEVTDAFPEPDAQSTTGLIAQPRPGELDHHAARRGIAGLADALVAIDRPAAKRTRS